MKKLYFLFIILISTASFGQIVINEIDSDTAGTDVAEFIELLWTPNTSLDGYVVVGFNGSDDLSYSAYDLDGYSTDANGFFILANTPIAVAGDFDLGSNNAVQNGADAIAVYQADDTDFPNDTPITLTNLIDVVIYGTSDGDDAGLIAGFGGGITQYDEGLNGSKDTESIQRSNDGSTYDTKAPTFRADNDAAVCELSLGSISAICDAFTLGTDTYTATVGFSGGGTSTYTVSADSGTVDLSGGNDPSVDASGIITVSGVSEGVDVKITVVDGSLCDLESTVTSPTCIPGITLPHSEDFSYADGSLVGNSAWASHGGTLGNLLVSSGQVIVQHGTPDEDVNLPFELVAGDLYYSFDFSLPDLGAPISGTDNEYFAHFKTDGFVFVAKMDIVPPSSAGDFSVGIGSIESVADAVWATDLNYDTTYRVTVKYDQVNNIAQLWIDASLESDTSIMGADEADPGVAVVQFGLRQSDSDDNEGILIDNLKIATTFAATTLSVGRTEIEGFAIYPNPISNGEFSIRSRNGVSKSVQIFDMLGKQVYSKEVQANENVKISNLNMGIYILKVQEEGILATRKLVVQ